MGAYTCQATALKRPQREMSREPGAGVHGRKRHGYSRCPAYGLCRKMPAETTATIFFFNSLEKILESACCWTRLVSLQLTKVFQESNWASELEPRSCLSINSCSSTRARACVSLTAQLAELESEKASGSLVQGWPSQCRYARMEEYDRTVKHTRCEPIHGRSHRKHALAYIHAASAGAHSNPPVPPAERDWTSANRRVCQTFLPDSEYTHTWREYTRSDPWKHAWSR